MRADGKDLRCMVMMVLLLASKPAVGVGDKEGSSSVSSMRDQDTQQRNLYSERDGKMRLERLEIWIILSAFRESRVLV